MKPVSAHWPDGPVLRRETHYGDRDIFCFAERPRSLDDMLELAARTRPDGEAVVDGSTRITHSRLRAIGARVAALFREHGLSAGDRVGLLLGNGWEFVAVLAGAAQSGIVTIPLSTRASAPEIAFILDDCGASLVVCANNLTALLPEGMDRIVAGPGEDFEAVLGDGTDGTAPEQSVAGPVAQEDDVAIILYTSGTTGKPKGAMLTHLSIIHSCMAYRHCLRLTAADRTIVAVPASHVTGLIANVFALLGVGGTVVMMPRFDADQFLALATAETMTFTIMVPAMYNLCLLRADFTKHDLSRWRIGAFGGAPMPVATIERMAKILPDLDLIQAYGATETTSPATIMPAGGQLARPASVGAPSPGASIRIVDDAGIDVPAGTAGEVLIAGPMVVPGYWRLAQKTAESFIDGYWRSGDVGRLDDEGYLSIHDRLKDMINRGGYKVYSAEVENVLNFHPSVAEVAVVPYADPVLGEKVQAFVYSQDAGIDAASLAQFCRERLSDYKVPDRFTFTEKPLPRNANGKLMKAALRAAANSAS